MRSEDQYTTQTSSIIMPTKEIIDFPDRTAFSLGSETYDYKFVEIQLCKHKIFISEDQAVYFMMSSESEVQIKTQKSNYSYEMFEWFVY